MRKIIIFTAIIVMLVSAPVVYAQSMTVTPDSIKGSQAVDITGVTIPDRPDGTYELVVTMVSPSGESEELGRVTITIDRSVPGDEFKAAVIDAFSEVRGTCDFSSLASRYVLADETLVMEKVRSYNWDAQHFFRDHPNACVLIAHRIRGILSLEPNTAYMAIAEARILGKNPDGSYYGHRAVIGMFPDGVKVINFNNISPVPANWILYDIW